MLEKGNGFCGESSLIEVLMFAAHRRFNASAEIDGGVIENAPICRKISIDNLMHFN